MPEQSTVLGGICVKNSVPCIWASTVVLFSCLVRYSMSISSELYALPIILPGQLVYVFWSPRDQVSSWIQLDGEEGEPLLCHNEQCVVLQKELLLLLCSVL
jgi:hypothetical protein